MSATCHHSLSNGQVTVGEHFVPECDVQGAIFDCDGTLIDSMLAWLPSWQHTCKLHGMIMTEQKFWGFAGVPLPDIVTRLYAEVHNENPSEEFIQSFLEEKMRFHKAHEDVTGSPVAIECVVAIARDFKARGVKIAIASSGLRSAVER